MSVLVKNMKIPVSCYECPMAEEIDMQEDWYTCNFLKKHFYSWDVTDDTKEYHRPKECPLVEVPTPHGRLIDSDKEKAEIDNMLVQGEVFTTAKNFASIVLENAPTVIEAEE